MELTPNLPQRVHFLGLGGAGVSGAARLLVARGHRVSGHDRADSPFLKGLAELGIAVDVGPSTTAGLPADAEVVVRSAAVRDDDPQVVAARERGVPVLKYAEVLGRLAARGRTLAVSGTHGKTTTSWFLERALEGTSGAHGPRPGALVGGTDLSYRTNAIVPDPDGWFAVEACEYDRSFMHIAPFGAIVTNVEADHLDCYGDLEGVIVGFARFARTVHPDGLLVVGDEVPPAVEHAARCAVWRLGRELELTYTFERGGCARLRLVGPGFAMSGVQLAVPGRVAAIDAALAAALALGTLPLEQRAAAAPCVATALASYRGTARRFEHWATFGDCIIVHDYAHHPTELAATFEAARGAYPDRQMVVLFQPHQHSRTSHFLDEFARVLSTADRAVVADVYGARVHVDGEHFAGSDDLARVASSMGGDVEHVPGLAASAARFAELLPDRAIALVLGAGDVENVKDDLLRHLSVRLHAASAAR